MLASLSGHRFSEPRRRAQLPGLQRRPEDCDQPGHCQKRHEIRRRNSVLSRGAAGYCDALPFPRFLP